MVPVACAILLVAATSALPTGSPPQAPSPRYPSEEALRRYAQGRLLEEQGRRDLAIGEYSRALLLDEAAGTLARRLSEVSAVTGEASRSLEFAERALSIDSTDARAQWLKGTALLHLDRAGEAVAPLQAATRLDPESVDYLRALGRAAESADRLDLAGESFRRAVRLEPDDAESWFQLGAAEARLGRFDEADSALGKVMDLNPLRPGLYLMKGLVCESQGRTEEAMESYRQHLTAHPGDVSTRRRAVNLLARERRFAEAWHEARILAHALPEDRESSEIEADLAYSAGRGADGDRAIRRIRKQWPDDPEALSGVVALLVRHGRGDRAVAEAEAWVKERPDDHRGHLVAARARALHGQPAGALEHYERAIALAPDSLLPRAMLARFYERERRDAEAERTWAEAAARFPEHNGLAFDLAACRERLGDIAGAEAAVRDVLRREPDNAVALNFLGYLWADHGQNLEEAVGLIVRALAQDPDNGAYLDSLGWAYYRLGRLGEARVQLERAVRHAQGDAVVHEHLADVYNDLQLIELAREQYRLSLAADPANGRVKAKLESLR